MISIVVVTIACFYRAGKSTNKNTVGFHRYNQLSNSDEEDTNLSIKIDSNGVSNGYSKNIISSKIAAATKFIKGGTTNTDNINFKLLNQLSDDDDEEEVNFTR